VPDPSNEPDLSWLADSPMFIDGQQIGAFYDAVVGPAFRSGHHHCNATVCDPRIIKPSRSVGGEDCTAIVQVVSLPRNVISHCWAAPWRSQGAATAKINQRVSTAVAQPSGTRRDAEISGPFVVAMTL
jgi:hypothetical protein